MRSRFCRTLKMLSGRLTGGSSRPATRIDSALIAAVLGQAALAWTWLRVQAFYEQQQREDGDE